MTAGPARAVARACRERRYRRRAPSSRFIDLAASTKVLGSRPPVRRCIVVANAAVTAGWRVLGLVAAVAMPFTDLAATLREFLAAIREGRKPETHLEDNVRTLAMVEAAIRSVETSQPVAVMPLVAAALGQ